LSKAQTQIVSKMRP